MPYAAYLVGLMYFHNLRRDGKLVLLPDGRIPPKGTKIAPHYGTFFLNKDDVNWDLSDWWEPRPNEDLEQIGVVELPIEKPSLLTMSGIERSGNRGCFPFGFGVDDSGLRRLPELTSAQSKRGLRIVPEFAQTIAQMPIRRGKLQSFLFGGKIKGAGITKLTVDHDEPIRILARVEDGTGFKSLHLKKRKDVVLSNTSRLVLDHEPEDTHFRLYGRLDVDRNDEKLRNAPPVPDLEPLAFDNPYLKFLEKHPGTVGEPGCSNTCC